MKRVMLGAVLLVGLLVLVTPTQAFLVNPGDSGSGDWKRTNLLHPLVYFTHDLFSGGGDTVLSITVLAPSILDSISVYDSSGTAKKFELLVDGSLYLFEEDGSTPFWGDYFNLPLSVGSHLLQFRVAGNDPQPEGNMEWYVGDLIPITAVPEPASLLLLGFGLIGIGAVVVRRR